MLAPRYPAALPACIKGLKDAEENVRWLCVDASRKLGPAAAAASPALEEALGDPSPRVRREALDVLRKVGVDPAPALRRLAAHHDPDQREWALGELKALAGAPSP